MNSILRYIGRYFEEVLASIFTVLMVILVIVNVFLRYGAGFTLPWSEEVAVILFIWSVFLGASACYKRKMHMGVDVLLSALPGRLQHMMETAISLLLLGINICMAVLAYQYFEFTQKTTPVLNLPYAVVVVPVILSFALMAWHSLRFHAEDFHDMSDESVMRSKTRGMRRK
jgi:TRAP-type C4-dicarboxylate transport system permease small subunit